MQFTKVNGSHLSRASVAAVALAAGLWASNAFAAIGLTIPTNLGAPAPFGANENTVNAYSAVGAGGADAELREGSSVADATSATGSHTVNREPDGVGTNSTEFATRHSFTAPIPPGTPFTNHSKMLLRFDISGVTPALLAANPIATLRLHTNRTSWSAARSADASNQYSLVYFGLNPTASGQNWVENTVTYDTAPGLLVEDTDGTTAGLQRSNDTKDWDMTQLTSLGTLPMQPKIQGIPVASDLPIGFSFDFSSAALHQLIADALTAGQSTVSVYVQSDLGSSGFNYVFAQKNTATMATQNGTFDFDGAGGHFGAAPSQYSAASNANGEFSPKLILSDTAIEQFIVPEPGSLALLGLAGVALISRRKRA